MAKHVNNWLEIRGYKKTAKAFKKVTGLKQKHTLMEERRQIMDYIVNGQISEAIELINAICPELLDKEPETYLLLKIQVFVELLVKQVSKPTIDYSIFFSKTQTSYLLSLNGIKDLPLQKEKLARPSQKGESTQVIANG